MKKCFNFNFLLLERPGSSDAFKLRLLSFNILAQALLESYPMLYKYHDNASLPWEIRKPLILEEIEKSEADVSCPSFVMRT